MTGMSAAPNPDVRRLEAENEILRAEVEFGIEKVLRMSTAMAEQAAVHNKRELLMERYARNTAQHLAHLKVVGRLLDEERAENSRLRALLAGGVS